MYDLWQNFGGTHFGKNEGLCTHQWIKLEGNVSRESVSFVGLRTLPLKNEGEVACLLAAKRYRQTFVGFGPLVFKEAKEEVIRQHSEHVHNIMEAAN